MDNLKSTSTDLVLGEKLRAITLHKNDMRMVAIVTVVVAAINVVIEIVWPDATPISVSLGLIPILIALIAVILAHRKPRFVEVYERGIRVISSAEARTIPWSDVTGVQTGRISDTYYALRISSLLAIMLSPSWATPHLTDTDYEPKPFDRCRYIFHLLNGEQLTLTDDVRLFGLTDDIKKNVFSRVVPQMLKRFEAGQPVDLTPTATYSKEGFKGTLIRETRHACREIPLDIPWADITRLFRTDTALQITAGKGQPIILPMSEIINAPGFIKILENLHDQGQIPALSWASR